jgi:hypothetical protein
LRFGCFAFATVAARLLRCGEGQTTKAHRPATYSWHKMQHRYNIGALPVRHNSYPHRFGLAQHGDSSVLASALRRHYRSGTTSPRY